MEVDSDSDSETEAAYAEEIERAAAVDAQQRAILDSAPTNLLLNHKADRDNLLRTTTETVDRLRALRGLWRAPGSTLLSMVRATSFELGTLGTCSGTGGHPLRRSLRRGRG
ncbi:hypothetical protein ScalyP_jg8071 [Parmales sp. scaly parma]|nr:hypothetical protein ScalyP_jg8071 [Parmales sp. scaly parma]